MSNALRRWSLALLVGWYIAASRLPPAQAEPPQGEAANPFEFAQVIDQLMDQGWQAAGLVPGEPCSDQQFLRRLYLDLLGRIPRVSETRQFLADPDPNKREHLIDELVHHPSHATRLTNLWRLFLLPLESDISTAANGAGFEVWLRERFAQNVAYDQIARELLTTEGNATDQGPALYYTAWELKPEKLAGSSARALLGMQIQCAECHDHPFDRWTQRDFWGYAAFFGQLQPLNDQPETPGFKEVLTGEVRLPNRDEVVVPRFPAGKEADAPYRSRREQLAAWVTADDNPFFAAATVNRVWFMLFGQGLVDPPDDMGKHNPSPHEDLLRALAVAFQEHHYDIRWLVQTLCRTRAYQLASAQQDDPVRALQFADMHVKVLTAEQWYDSLQVAVCHPQENGLSGPTFGINRTAQANRQLFLTSFRSPSIAVRDFRLGIAQALLLMNGAMVDADTSLEQSALLGALDAPFLQDQQKIEILFLAVLSRFPTATEQAELQTQIQACHTPSEVRELCSDLLWALLNSSEFALNR